MCTIVSMSGLDFPKSQHNRTRLWKSVSVIKHTQILKLNINNLTFNSSLLKTFRITCEWQIKPFTILFLEPKLWASFALFDLMRVHRTGHCVNPHSHAPLHSVTLRYTPTNSSTLCTGAVTEINEVLRELEHIWTCSHHLTKRTGAAGRAAVVCRAHLPVAWKSTAGGSLKPAPLKLKCAAEKRPGGRKSQSPRPVQTQSRDKTTD